MSTELFRNLKNPLYWLIIGSGLAVRTALAFFDSLYRGPQFWELALDFWNKTGSVTIGVLILLVLIRCFSYDVETGVFSVVNSTAYGRLHLLLTRLAGGALAAVLAAALLWAGNIGISSLLGGHIEAPYGWAGRFSRRSMTALAGAAGFYTASALICDLTKNHPAAMCLCGPIFAGSYFINPGEVKPPELFWFWRYGFFTELTRGSALKSLPIFWLGWYPALLAFIFFLAVRRRKEDREL